MATRSRAQYYEVGRNADPEFRSARARAAAEKANGIDALVRRVIARSSELSDAHKRQLAAALVPTGGEAR